jgi:hypothetical protein
LAQRAVTGPIAALSQYEADQMVGRIVGLWSNTELYVKVLVGQLLTPDESAAQIATYDAGWPWLKDQLANLGAYRAGTDAALQEELKATIQALNRAVERRNAVAHSQWGAIVAGVDADRASAGSIKRLRLRGKGTAGPRLEIEEWDRTDFQECFELVSEGFRRVATLGVSFGQAGLLYRTQPEQG